jgi:hypothetical protein
VISTRWIEKRRLHWTRLERLVENSGRRGVSALSPGELQELALLYRQTASDLASVREDPTSSQLALYLNQLLGRAHNLIYMGRKATGRGMWIFFKDEYPAVFRATFPDTFAAFLIFLAAGFAGFLMGIADPGFSRHVLGPQMIETIEKHKMWTDSIVTIKATASSAILTNNLSVAFATFALGITAGIGTVYMMLVNGLLIGVISVACWREGMSLQLWGFVAAHGSHECAAGAGNDSDVVDRRFRGGIHLADEPALFDQVHACRRLVHAARSLFVEQAIREADTRFRNASSFASGANQIRLRSFASKY